MTHLNNANNHRWKTFFAGERKPFDMETFRHFDELVAKEKQDKEKEKERTKKSKAKQRQLGEDKTSNISSTSLRRSKRKSTGPEKSMWHYADFKVMKCSFIYAQILTKFMIQKKYYDNSVYWIVLIKCIHI